MPLEWSDLNPFTWPGQVASRFKKDLQPGGLFGPSLDQARLHDAQRRQANAANAFAGVGEQGYGAMTAESAAARDYLRRLASGEESVSREQLRQDTERNRAAQQSFVASAAPQNQAMAGIVGANNMARANYGMSGNAAIAGIAERGMANQSLANLIMQQRQQDLQAALQSRANANAAYGAYKPDPSSMEKAASFLPLLTISDKRLKEDIEDGAGAANKAMKSLRAYTFKYKAKRHGKGKQVGVMAQDLEKAGLEHAVVETPVGKAVDGGKLATANTAMLAALEKRVSKIEGKRK